MFRQEVNISDNQGKNLFDKCNFAPLNNTVRKRGTNSFASIKNRVVIESRDIVNKNGKILKSPDTEVVEDTTNLIVYHGRHWLMQRAFDLDFGANGYRTNNGENDGSNSSIVRSNYHNKWINWFAVGGGGTLFGQPLEPDNPTEADWHLGDPLRMWQSDGYTYNAATDTFLRLDSFGTGTYYGSGTYTSSQIEKDFHKIDDGYPLYLTDWNVTGHGSPPYQQDPNYGDMQAEPVQSGFVCDSYLRAHIRITLANNEANGQKYYDPASSDPTYQDISEAALYASPSDDPQNFSGVVSLSEGDAIFRQWQPEMFARVCFSTIRKDETRELVFNWYVYF